MVSIYAFSVAISFPPGIFSQKYLEKETGEIDWCLKLTYWERQSDRETLMFEIDLRVHHQSYVVAFKKNPS